MKRTIVAAAFAAMLATSNAHAAPASAPDASCAYSNRTEDGGQFAICEEGDAWYFDADGQPYPNAAGVPVRAPGWVRIA